MHQVSFNTCHQYSHLQIHPLLTHKKQTSFYIAHYYSYVFNFGERRWYKLDDSVVLEVEESDVLNDAFEGLSSAFMLQYVSTKELVSGDWHESISSSTPGDDVPSPDLPSAATATSPSNSVEDEVMENEGLSDMEESDDQLQPETGMLLL